MIRSLLLALALTVALPFPAFAKRMCFTDTLRIYLLDVQGACKKQKPGSRKVKTAAVRGFTTGDSCPKSALNGTCIGSEDGVTLQLTVHPEPGNGCTKFLVYATGASLASLSGSYDNAPFGATEDGSISLTTVGCP